MYEYKWFQDPLSESFEFNIKWQQSAINYKAQHPIFLEGSTTSHPLQKKASYTLVQITPKLT